MIVYHGSDRIVDSPDVHHSIRNLDFGQGFYVTSVKVQAERWANRKANMGSHCKGIVSMYQLNESPDLIVKDFADDLESWIDFVCACRDGSDVYKQYDVIKGKVANDKVFRVVDMYKKGIWDKARAIREFRVYESFDQMALITQKAIDSMLIYKGSYEV